MLSMCAMFLNEWGTRWGTNSRHISTEVRCKPKSLAVGQLCQIANDLRKLHVGTSRPRQAWARARLGVPALPWGFTSEGIRQFITKAALVFVLIHSGVAPASETRLHSAVRSFPESRERILVYADQLPSQLTDAQWKFVATHYVGGQKQTRSWVRTIRQLNPNFLMMHYQLGLGAGPAKFVVGDEWTSDFDQLSKHDGWFLHARLFR
jgi:hypothetical protein